MCIIFKLLIKKKKKKWPSSVFWIERGIKKKKFNSKFKNNTQLWITTFCFNPKSYPLTTHP